jgi:PilZ domain
MQSRRMFRRYDLSFPVRIRVEGGRNHVWSAGQTRDISSRGIYVSAQEIIAVGAEVEMYITLPKITRGTEAFVHAFGRVLRVEEPKETQDAVGVAAMIERYDITRGAST